MNERDKNWIHPSLAAGKKLKEMFSVRKTFMSGNPYKKYPIHIFFFKFWILQIEFRTYPKMVEKNCAMNLVFFQYGNITAVLFCNDWRHFKEWCIWNNCLLANLKNYVQYWRFLSLSQKEIIWCYFESSFADREMFKT